MSDRILNRLSNQVCCIKKQLEVRYVVIEDSSVDFPLVGDENTLYISRSTGVQYYWDTGSYLPLSSGYHIQLATNYSALPSAASASGEFYWCENSQGTQWLPGSLGGTYYPKGMYYSNGSTWEYTPHPYQATQLEVNTGVNNDKFVTPLTFENASKWGTKVDVVFGKQLSTEDYTTVEKSKLASTPTSFAPLNAEENVQADWNESNNLLDAYIKNKPTTFPPSSHTHTSSDITDFQTNVSINSDVVANTAARHTHSNLSTLNAIQEALTTALKSAYDSASNWVVTNGTNVLNHLSNTSNPHSVTKSQVGLSNVDNTSDINKPISTATQTALDGKVDENTAITGATKTKITYDAKGLVTSGVDATTADIADSINKRYVTDANLTVIGNTSGTNTGDETTGSIQTKRPLKTIEGQSLEGSGNIDLTKSDVGLSNVVNLDTSTTTNITDSTNKRFVTDAFLSSLGFITITQAVNLDTLESDTVTNNAKVTNATHTGEVTGATALTLDKTAITNKTSVTVDSGDYLLVSDTSDSGNLKKGLVSDIISLAGTGTTNLTYTASPTNGLVNSDTGTDATLPLADATNAGLLKPAKYTVLENTSGTNTGDQTTIVGITGTKAQFDAAVTDGNILYVGDITQYTDELAQDAIGAMVGTSIVYNDASATLQRAALTGAITSSQDSNSTVLGSFTKVQLDAAVSDGNVMFIGDAPTSHTHLLSNITDVTMTVANLNSLDDGFDSTLHFHSSDRDRSNHTGTQLASTISDIQTTITNNAAVLANTAKITNATHTGEVIGSGSLTVDKTAISNRTTATIVGGDFLLFGDTSDSDNLKKGLVSDIVILASGAYVISSHTTSPVNVVGTSGEYMILVDCTSGNITVNLPTAVGNTAKYNIVKTDNSSNTVIIDPFSTQTINGESDAIIYRQHTCFTVISDNVNLRII